MKENFYHKNYRDNLASELRAESDPEIKRELLAQAKKTPEYIKAEVIHRQNSKEQKQHLIETGFTEEAGALEKVIDLAKIIEMAGGRALLVGGSVRDEFFGLPPKDYDIEVYGIDPEKLRLIAQDFGKVNEVGAAFGILKVVVGDFDIDISLPRRESKTGTGHRDFSVSADPHMSIEEAARRRDFTFNALAKDILTGEVFDYFGGMQDIENKTLRVTDEERFRDDPLRVLRGVQFVGRFGLKVDDKTSSIMREMRPELNYLPKERLKEEWLKLFTKSRKPSLGLSAAMEIGIFHEMHPDIVQLTKTPQEKEWHPEGDVWVHTLMVVDEAAKIVETERLKGNDAAIVMLSAFCHDLGKPTTTEFIDGRIKSLGHEEAGAEPTKKFLSSIGLEGSLRDQVAKLVIDHLKPSQFYIQEVLKGQKITDGAIKRLASRIAPATIKHLVCLCRADHLGRGPFVDPSEPEKSFMPDDFPAGAWLLERATKLGVFEDKPKPVLFGRDLVALGFKPGPLFGEIIKVANDLHVLGMTREEILLYIGNANEHQSLNLSDVLLNLETVKEMKE